MCTNFKLIALDDPLESMKMTKRKLSHFKGVTFPCIHAVWSRWAPPLERSRMATMAFAGNYAGTVVSMPASGLLAKYFGWESLFYVFGLYMPNEAIE